MAFLEDKSLNPGVKADPFSLDALIEWLEKQPGEKTYNFYEYDECLWGMYTTDNGGTLDRESETYHLHGLCMNARGFGMPRPQVMVAVGTPWTVSAALERAIDLRGAP